MVLLLWWLSLYSNNFIEHSKRVYTLSQKTVQNCFCQNFLRFPQILIIFGRAMAKKLKLCKVYSFSTSTNSHHHTTVWNADVRNCYTTLYVVASQSLLISPSSLFISAIGLCRLWRPMAATIRAVMRSTFLYLTVLIDASKYSVSFSGISMFHFRAWNP